MIHEHPTPHATPPTTGAEGVSLLDPASATPAELVFWLCTREQPYMARHHDPLTCVTLDDATLLEQPFRSAAIWDRILEARTRGALRSLRLTLCSVRPRAVDPAWFAIAAAAGVVDIVFDLSSLRINDAFSTLKTLCTQASDQGIAPTIRLALAGPDFDLTESACRTVVLLKNELPWRQAPCVLTPEARRRVSADLAAAVEQGMADTLLLGDLLLGPWMQHLPPVDRRVLFPVMLAAQSLELGCESNPSSEAAIAGLHSRLRPPLTAWIAARALK